MTPNVVTKQGELVTIFDVMMGAILLHNDFPVGIAARNIKRGEVLKYNPSKNTDDIIIKAQYANAP